MSVEDPFYLLLAVILIRDELRQKLKSQGKTLMLRTTGLHHMQDLTPELEGEEDVTMVVQTTGKFFLREL